MKHADDKPHTAKATETDAQLLERARKLHKIDWNADWKNREDAIEDLAFRCGGHWDPIDRMRREANGQPVFTVNHAPKFINQVVGDMRQNRPSIIIKPDGFGADSDRAEILNGMVRNIQRRARSTEPFLTAVDGSASCGIGHFRIITEYLPDNPFDQELSLVPIMNPLAVTWDANARLPDRSDATRCWVLTGRNREDFMASNPRAAISSWDSLDHSYHHWYPAQDIVLVAEFFELVQEPTTFLKIEGGGIVDVNRLSTMLEWDEARGLLTNRLGQVLEVVDQKDAEATRCRWYRMTGEAVLDRGEWVTGHIPIIPMVGPETHFEDRVERSSLIRWAKDPMRRYNYMVSTHTEIIDAMPKVPYLIGTRALDGVEDEWATMNKVKKGYLTYNDIDPDNPDREVRPPTRIAPPTTPPGLANEISLSRSDMNDTTGIYAAALGDRSNETSGVAINARKAESDVSTSIFGSRAEGAMTRAGTILVAAIPRVYDTNRTVRVVHSDNSDNEVEINGIKPDGAHWAIHNDITQGRYDATSDVGPSYASQQEQSLTLAMELLRDDPEAKAAMRDLLFEMTNAPNKEQIVKRLRKIMPPGMVEGEDAQNEEVNPALALQQQAAEVMMKAETRLKTAEATEKEARAEEARAKAETAKAETLLTKIEAAEAAGQVRPGAAQILKVFMAMPLEQLTTPGDPSGTATGPMQQVPFPGG